MTREERLKAANAKYNDSNLTPRQETTFARIEKSVGPSTLTPLLRQRLHYLVECHLEGRMPRPIRKI
jgi:hypothetical protein